MPASSSDIPSPSDARSSEQAASFSDAARDTELRLRDQGEYLRRLLESSPDCIKTLDLDGNILSMTEHGQRVMDIDDFSDVCGRRWISLLQDEASRDGVSAAIEAAKAGGTGRFHGFCPTLKGVPKWWDVLVVSLLDTDGRPEQLLSISRDVTEQHQAEERTRLNAERERARLNDLFQKTPAFMALLRGPQHIFEMANPLYMKSIGYRDIIGKPVSDALPEVVDQGFVELMDRVYSTGEPFVAKNVRVLLQTHDAGPPEEYFIDPTYQPLRDEDGEVYAILAHGVDVTERNKLEREREQLLLELRTRAEREALLSDASRVLNASLDYEETLAAIARLIVPRFADWCAVDLKKDVADPQRVAVEHINPEKAAWGWELNRRYPTRRNDERGIAAVLRTGKSSFTPQVTDEMLAASIADPERLRLMLEIGFTSVMIVPLAVRDRVFGALSLIATQESGRIFTEDDLQFAQELGQRAGLAVENARLFRETRHRADREALLNQVGEAVRTELEPEAILRAAVSALGIGLNADRCYFVRSNQARGIARVAHEWLREELRLESLLDREFQMAAYATNRDPTYTAGRTQVINDVNIYGPEGAAELQALGIRAVLRVPIEVGPQMTNLIIAMAREPRQWTEEEVRLAENVATLVRSALESAHVRMRERNIALQLQDALQPPPPTDLPGLALASHYRPALAEASVGGDFYDVFPVEEGCTALVVADLSGKGLQAASQVATVRNMLRFSLYSSTTLAEAITDLHRALVKHDLLTGFATLFVGIYDELGRNLTYVNCGQEPGLLWRAATEEVEHLSPTGTVLGGFGDGDFSEEVVSLASGDVLAIFTDGLTEVGPSRKVLLEIEGVSDILWECCSQQAAGSSVSQSIVDRLIARVDDYAGGGARDDIALLVGVLS